MLTYIPFEDVGYSFNENNGQNSFYLNIFVILNVNAPYPFPCYPVFSLTQFLPVKTSKVSRR